MTPDGGIQDANAAGPILTPEPTPPIELARWGAMTARLSDSEMLVAHGFTGFPKSATSADVFRVKRDASGFKTTAVKSSGAIPPATSRANLFASAAMDRAYLIGGRTSGTSVSDNTVYELTISSGNWTKLALDTYPKAFLACGNFMHPSKAIGYQFGGASASGYSQETWAFDFSGTTPKWRLIENKEEALTARFDPSIALSTDGKYAYLFGGGTGVQPTAAYRNDVWQFDFESERWTLLYANSADGPIARRGAWIVAQNGKLFMAGGEPAQDSVKDFWQFDLTTKVWTQIAESVGFDEAVFPLALTFDKTSWLVGGYVQAGLATNQTSFVLQ